MTWSVSFRLRRYLRESLGLPLIVAIVGIGSDRGDIWDSVGASLIGAGMISVLAYPLVGMRLARAHAMDDETSDARFETSSEY